MADILHCDLILTTGGTGLAPRDVTPEATCEILDREVPGIAEAIRAAGLRHKAAAMLSRGLSGTRGNFRGALNIALLLHRRSHLLLGGSSALLRPHGRGPNT